MREAARWNTPTEARLGPTPELQDYRAPAWLSMPIAARISNGAMSSWLPNFCEWIGSIG